MRCSKIAKAKRMRMSALAAGCLHAAVPLSMTGAHAEEAGAPNRQENPAPALSDNLFSQPYIDIDEWRSQPVRHRYVHGGFKGTETRFSFYFPPKAEYRGRFFQHITPVPDNENLAQKMPAGAFNKIGFSIASGAYFVETNGGGHMDLGKTKSLASDQTITAWRANAAAAEYSRTVAEKMYGAKRPYGYAYGGSGGAYRTIGSIENTQGVWDGVVPYVPGSTMAIPNMFTVRMQAMRLLDDKFPQIVDAVEPGGSGDPYAGLSPLQASALREATRMGFPTPSWFGYKTMGIHGMAALYQGVVMADPTYFTDFWTKPGYLGHDHPEYFEKARLQFASTVAAPITALEAQKLGLNTDASSEATRGGVDRAFEVLGGTEAARIVAFRLNAGPPPKAILGADLIVGSGAASGQRLPVARIVNDIVVLGLADSSVAARIAAGDKIEVDNSNFLALETYHRHQVPGPDFPVWNQFRDQAGKPIYPQRPMLIGPLFVQATSGSQMTGKFEGKMILLSSLWDREAMPWQADWYFQRVRSHLGDRTDANLRLWYTDHALHGDEPVNEDPNRIVSYQGALQQALRDLSAWVEKGVTPPASTSYRIEDGQVIVPPGAAERRGIQPVVDLKVTGGDKAEVKAGQSVKFAGTITAPPGAGKLIAAEWDFSGKGAFDVSSRVPKGAQKLSVTIDHAFPAPGTYFVALRGALQREGDSRTPYARIENLGRVRVVVR
ncbi:PKD domain-containing protein [Novosphingobium sp. TCA1]|nr:PKD domain-containing protein [Novosphingobium sp. TCA1]